MLQYLNDPTARRFQIPKPGRRAIEQAQPVILGVAAPELTFAIRSQIMSREGQTRDIEGVEGLNLAHALRDCLASGVLVVNRREQITACTPEAERLLQLAPGRIAHVTLSSLPAPLQNLIHEVIAAKTAITHRTVALRAQDQKQITLQVSAVPVQAAQPEALDVVVILHDLTGAVRLEQNIQRLDRLATIGTLAASMGHEIKNALVAVKTFVDLLLDQNRDAELADVVRREMSRIDSIVGQMLKFGGPAQPNFSTVRVHELLEHSLRMVQHRLDGKLIALHRSFQAAPDSIQGDDYQLEQAFLNLFLNAADAMGPNGKLTVATETVPGNAGAGHRHPQVRITVADTGIGVAPENMAQMFEPFFTTKSHGTGLGLPITRRIMQEHHGEITVASELNKGTTFTLLLPTGVKPALRRMP